MDRISELPDPILHHILFFMPIKDAARTIVLSKSWLITWSSFKNNFVFNEQVYLQQFPSAKREDFMNWVGKSLSQKVKIEMFSLHMTLSNHDADAFHVDRWIQFVTTNHNLQVLLLDFTMTRRTKMYVLHDITNVAASLAFLMLRNCELRRPFFAFFLKDLSLTSISVCGNHIIENLLSSCHLLQRFHIVDCSGTNKLRVIDLPCLKAATIEGVSMIEIVRLPNLEKLEYACLGPSTLEVIDCNNLKEFCFLEYSMTEEQTIEQFSSKFPFLEKLKL